MKRQTPIRAGGDAARKQALANAAALVSAGRYDDALATLRAGSVLTTANGQAIAGNIHIKQGRLDEALKAFDAAVRLAPGAPEPHANRGVALLELGRLDAALAAFDKALGMRPEYAGAHFNRGNVLKAMGRHADAVAAFARAVRAQPAFAQAHVHRGQTLLVLERWQEALEDFSRALRLQPAYAAAHVGSAMAYRGMGGFDEAFAAVDAALALEGDAGDAARLRADLLYEGGRYAEAVAAADALLARNPDDTGALAERARSLLKLARPVAALEAAERIVLRAPGRHEAYVIKAAILSEMGRYEDSLATIEEARRLGAPEGEYRGIRALALATLGDSADALAEFELALAANPGALPTYTNRAFLRLVIGDWPGAWDDHEWRLKQPAHPHRFYATQAAQWQGEALAGKRLLLYGEQGLGDTLQFVRYVPRLQAMGAAITLIVPEVLMPLFTANFPTVDVAAAIGMRTGFDYQASLMSLPAIVRETLATLPRDVPYLVADGARIAKWQARLGGDGFRVGIVWQGGKKYVRDATRSMPLRQFAPLAAVPGVRLISVQAQVGLEQLDDLPAGMKVERLGEEIENNPDGFREIAALMASLDLLVMSDTGPTHLAGALGRPVWVALPRYPDWRWMRGREDSPWYPTMRLFRQEAAGDWDGVFQRIAEALRSAVERATAGRVS